jgi:hypothetical protein
MGGPRYREPHRHPKASSVRNRWLPERGFDPQWHGPGVSLLPFLADDARPAAKHPDGRLVGTCNCMEQRMWDVPTIPVIDAVDLVLDEAARAEWALGEDPEHYQALVFAGQGGPAMRPLDV